MTGHRQAHRPQTATFELDVAGRAVRMAGAGNGGSGAPANAISGDTASLPPDRSGRAVRIAVNALEPEFQPLDLLS